MDPGGLISWVGSTDGSFRDQERLGRGVFVASECVSGNGFCTAGK
jgi:hypothetical protein